MEYSLYRLNKLANLSNTKISDIIDKLNLIGFEVDEIFEESLSTNNFINDTRLLVEIPSNREDLLNEQLFLKELATVFLFDIYEIWTKLQKNYPNFLNQKYIEYENQESKPIQSDISDILIYKLELENCFLEASPLWIQQKLKNAGITITNDINDFLNLVTLEYGSTITSNLKGNNLFEEFSITRILKPTNFYDGHKDFMLPEGTVVLKNHEDIIVSVLGVFTSINNMDITNSNKIFLESIFYDIHENNLDINTINTKLSFRYLRKMFFENFKISFQRLLTLLDLYNPSLKVINNYTNVSKSIPAKSKKLLRLEKALIKKVLNVEKFEREIFKKASLEIICETKNSFYFYISEYRKDLNRQIDLIEEYSRFIGYKNFEEILPLKELVHNSKKLTNYLFIQQFFIDYGLNEIFTNSLQADHEKTTKFTLKLSNPLNSETKVLRTSLFPKLFEVFDLNFKLGFSNCNFFEIGRVFKVVNNKIIEQDKVSGIFHYLNLKNSKQPSLDWFIVKGFLENFVSYFGYETIEFTKIKNKKTYFHPTRSVHFIFNGKILGTFGEVNPTIETFRSTKLPIYIFEFNLHHFKTWRLKSNIQIAKEYSKYPSIVKDLSFSINKNENFSLIKEKINANFLKSITFFDVYFDAKELTQVSIGIRLEFQSTSETLTTTTIEKEVEKVRAILVDSFGAEFKG
jgi:phenylalanyl-tRNA synthetase beta chain|tara:strand:- start:11971 stop:14031 length:2061 start_codon:yes stop_codon:yes gene_type:complete